MRRLGEEAVIRFDYDRALVRAVKGLERRRFDARTKEWVVPLYLYADALARLEAAGGEVELDDDLQTMLAGGLQPRPPEPEVHVGRTGGNYIIRFEYEPRLVKAVKEIPGRTFDPSAKAWFVPIQDEVGTLGEVLRPFEAAGCTIHLDPDVERLLAAPLP